MVLTGERLADATRGMHYPMRIRHHQLEACAIERADREMVEELSIRGALVGRFEGDRLVDLRLTMPMSSLQYRLRTKRLPVADGSRTVVRRRSSAGTIIFEFSKAAVKGWC